MMTALFPVREMAAATGEAMTLLTARHRITVEMPCRHRDARKFRLSAQWKQTTMTSAAAGAHVGRRGASKVQNATTPAQTEAPRHRAEESRRDSRMLAERLKVAAMAR